MSWKKHYAEREIPKVPGQLSEFASELLGKQVPNLKPVGKCDEKGCKGKAYTEDYPGAPLKCFQHGGISAEGYGPRVAPFTPEEIESNLRLTEMFHEVNRRAGEPVPETQEVQRHVQPIAIPELPNTQEPRGIQDYRRLNLDGGLRALTEKEFEEQKKKFNYPSTYTGSRNWFGFKIAAPMPESFKLPAEFPREDWDNQYDQMMSDHNKSLGDLLDRFWPNREKGWKPTNDDVIQLKHQSMDTWHLFRQQYGQTIYKHELRKEKFDSDLDTALRRWNHEKERKENQKTDEQLAEDRRQRQRVYYQSPAVQLDRQIRNVIQYGLTGQSVRDYQQERYETDPDFRQRQQEQARARSQRIRSTEQGRIHNNIYLREFNRLKKNKSQTGDPLTDCPCGCNNSTKEHYKNLRSSFDQEWSNLEFTDNTQKALKSCECGCGKVPQTHMIKWYRNRVDSLLNPPKQASRFWLNFKFYQKG